jgi:hypothetical protein
MRTKRSFIVLILFVTISMMQACVPQSVSNDSIQTKAGTPKEDPTKNATEIILTKTPKTIPTRTLIHFTTTDVDPVENWTVTQSKSASIATSIGPEDDNISTDADVAHNTEKIPTKTNPVSTVNPEPTATSPTPEPTPFAGCPNGCTYHPDGCDIKGNISIATGEKIYHVPGGEFYDACVISPDYGERWFCTEQEAIDNGWRKSKY